MSEPDQRAAKGGWAPGTYTCRCCNCGVNFVGAKHAVTCADCAYSGAPAPDLESPDPVRELIDRLRRHLWIADGDKWAEAVEPDLRAFLARQEVEVIAAAMEYGRIHLAWQDGEISDEEFEGAMNGDTRDKLIGAVRDALRDVRKEAPDPARELAEERLAPCPFCGSTFNPLATDDEPSIIGICYDARHGLYAVACDRCEIDGPFAESTEEASRLWSDRAFLAQRDGQVAAMRAALEPFATFDGSFHGAWSVDAHDDDEVDYDNMGTLCAGDFRRAAKALAPGAGEREAESEAVRLLVWVHSHAETGEADQLDIGEVDGRANVHAVQQLIEANDLEPFVDVDFPLDEWRWCTVELEYDWPEPDVGFHGRHWLRILSVGSAEDMEGHPVYWCDALRDVRKEAP